MPIDTNKFSLQDIYSYIAYHFGATIADGVEFPMVDRLNFLRMVNKALTKIASATDCVERLALLQPDRRWLRYLQITPEMLENGWVRIDLQGQLPVTQDANDPACLDWQYERHCCRHQITLEATAAITRDPVIGSRLENEVTGAVLIVSDFNIAAQTVTGYVLPHDINLWSITDTVDDTTGHMQPDPFTIASVSDPIMCTDGITPDYWGDIVADEPPDSFPKIYLPAECNIPVDAYGTQTINEPTLNDYKLTAPLGNQNRIGGGNEPTTPFVIDMRKTGYGSGDPTSDDYPTATQTHLYFIDPFLIYAMRLINYVPPAGGTGLDYAIPHSSDAYLNDTWTTILGLSGVGAITVSDIGADTGGASYFNIDGIDYQMVVDVANNTMNLATDLGFHFTITSSQFGTVWNYSIVPSHTPWQTIRTAYAAATTGGTDRWGELFDNQALYANRAFYVKMNDFVIRLPDDMRKIKWIWKVPLSTQYIDIPADEEYRRLGFAALATAPTVGSILTQATTGATLVVTSSDTTLNYVYGQVTGVFDTTNGVTGGGMVPTPNIPTSVALHYLIDPTNLGDAEYLNYSRYDDAYHYFPITETRFTQLKYLETEGYDFRGAGFYIQFGQQLRLVPRPSDLNSFVMALVYEAKPDNVPLTLGIAEFAHTYVEIPNEAVEVIQDMIIASIYASSRGGGNMEQAVYFKSEAERALIKLENLYGGRQRQSHDAPSLKNALDPYRNTRHFGFGHIYGLRRRNRIRR
jgi:hypothetical protein